MISFSDIRKKLARAIHPRARRPTAFDHYLKRVLREADAAQASGPRGAPDSISTRMYHAARVSRTTSGWAPATGSADSELRTSLRQLRDRARALVRDAAYAKRAKRVVQNNVVGGAGVGMQAQVMSTRDELRTAVNQGIEDAWQKWCCAENCHTGESLHFADLEYMLAGETFEAGDVLVRMHVGSQFGGRSGIPLGLEIIESERLADDFSNPQPPGPAEPGNVVKMGVEVNAFGAPRAYWIRTLHPGEWPNLQTQVSKIERVPAAQILPLRIIDRWPQTRGEPWLHTAVRKLNDMDAYSEAELTAARGQASYFGTIKSPTGKTALANADTSDPSGPRNFSIESGVMYELAEGEEVDFHTSTRPNTALDPFMRYMLREIAAGVGCSYESLSRDYSQHNYSSSRLALLDDRDLWRVLQGWYIRSFRYRLHSYWLKIAVLSGAIPQIPIAEYAAAPEKFEAALFKPRGWGWIDPVKEVDAYRQALISGFTTRAHIIATTGDGMDIEDVDRQRKKEVEAEKTSGLIYDTSPEIYTQAGAPEPKQPSPEEGGGSGGRAEGSHTVVPLKEVRK